MSQIIDLVGQKFNKLTVISLSHVKKYKPFWNCLCECGKAKVVSSGCLKNNYTKSCGCSNPAKFKDKTGNRYTRLLVIKLHSYGGKGNTYWECLCDCGKTVYAEQGSLRNKRSLQSCGCIHQDIMKEVFKNNRKDITNQKFNRWTALRRVDGRNKLCLWECQCDCGKYGKVPITALKRGYSKSCGCLTLEKNKSRTREKSHRWNPNLTEEERQLSKTRGHNPELHQWRKEVYKRDYWTCQITKIKSTRKQKICAHHIEAWNSNKELRFDIDNGVVLLAIIHKLFHKIYGNGYNTRDQFNEFKIRYDNGEFNSLLSIDLVPKVLICQLPDNPPADQTPKS